MRDRRATACLCGETAGYGRRKGLRAAGLVRRRRHGRNAFDVLGGRDRARRAGSKGQAAGRASPSGARTGGVPRAIMRDR